MAEGKQTRRASTIRSIVLLFLLSSVAYFVWRSLTRREDYAGGDVRTTGTMEAVRVQLGFQVAGRIADVPVSEGDRVRPGQVVARLETQDLQVEVQTARAAGEAARAALAQARANREKAERDLARTRSLLSSGVSTPQQMDIAQAAARVAEAQVRAGQAQVRQAEAALVQAQLQLSHAELRTPEAGEVSEKIHRPGEMVTVGVPVVALVQTDTLKVRAAVDETRVGAVRPGDRVVVRVYTFDQRTFPGVVTDIEPAGEFATRKDWGAQRRDIRTFTVTARVPNSEHLLKDGMTAVVTIRMDPSLQKMARAKR